MQRASEIEIADTSVLLALAGPNNAGLRTLESAVGISIGLRGNTIMLRGEDTEVDLAERFLTQASELVGRGIAFGAGDVERAIATLRNEPNRTLGDVFTTRVRLGTRRRRVEPKSVAQRDYVQAIADHDLVFGIGPAGTGKTYLAMASAVAALIEKRVRRIVLTRPAVEAGEKLGFLPGDLAEKVHPYLRPLYDALTDMLDGTEVSTWMERGAIEVAPLAFMRGRTLNDSFVILDEAQNATREQMRMFLTRLGYDSKAVVTGDVTQVDLPRGRASGLAHARSILGGIDGIAFVTFSEGDVVRHPLVRRIVAAYEADDASPPQPARAPTEPEAESPPNPTGE